MYLLINYKTIMLIQDIVSGEELLVWYGGSYTMYMGLPYILSAYTHGSTADSAKGNGN